MKKKLVTIGLIVLLCAILAKPLLQLIVVVFWASTPLGPYHHSAYVDTAQEIVDLDGRKFSNIHCKLFELKENGFYEVEIDVEDAPIRNIKAYDDKLYVNANYSIMVFNKNLERVDTIEINVASFIVDDEYLYYSSHNYDSAKNFYAYNFNTKEKILVANKLTNNICQFNNKLIYANDSWNTIDITDKSEYTSYYNNFYKDQILSISVYKPSFYVNSFSGHIGWKNNKLVITYGDNTYDLDLDKENIIYCPVHVIGNKVIFASFEYLDNDDCTNSYDCICHYGKNYIWSFDCETKSIAKLHEFDKGTYLINFNENDYSYYKDGKIYRNSQEIKEVDIAEPYGSFVEMIDDRDFYESRVSDSYFYDDGENLFYSYFNYMDIIKNKY